MGALAGCDPTIMGIGPIPAIKKIFEKTGLSPKDIGAIELNEAFASQSLACIRDLKLDNENAPFDKVNVWGGAIALGHPLGQSGARVLVTLLNVMKTEFPNERYGLASLCGAFGNGAALPYRKSIIIVSGTSNSIYPPETAYNLKNVICRFLLAL